MNVSAFEELIQLNKYNKNLIKIKNNMFYSI